MAPKAKQKTKPTAKKTSKAAAKTRRRSPETVVVPPNHEEIDLLGRQVLFYGLVGSGKSWLVEKEIGRAGGGENTIVRCTFHPGLSRADFVGRLCADGSRFVPGPFAFALRQALRSPCKPHFLVLEDIDRCDADAVFGDTLQLLDRYRRDEVVPNKGDFETTDGDCAGWSRHPLFDEALEKYLRDPEETTDSDLLGVRLPPNLSIYATAGIRCFSRLNAPLLRRFEARLVQDDKYGDIGQWDARIAGPNVPWGWFLEAINREILLAGGPDAEDKCLGSWFVVADENGEIPGKTFAEKVIGYLWTVFEPGSAHDIFRRGDSRCFRSLAETINAFYQGGFRIFRDDLLDDG